jgi:acetaldehyde dehydrogenase (acetylating)
LDLRDRDLISLQEARDLVARAAAAQKKFAAFSQQQIDAIVEACAVAATAAGESLARLAVEETGYGNARFRRSAPGHGGHAHHRRDPSGPREGHR